MIAIAYLGDEQYFATVTNNHDRLIGKIQAAMSAKRYNFTDSVKPWINKYNDDATIDGRPERQQLYDFYQALKNVEEDIVVRLRSDVWFTEGAMDVIVNEITEVANGNVDMSFIGGSLILQPDARYVKQTYTGTDDNPSHSMNDFCVIVNRTKVPNETDVFTQEYVTNDWRLGRGFFKLISETSNVNNVIDQIYLVTSLVDNPTDAKIVQSALQHVIDTNSFPEAVDEINAAYAIWEARQFQPV